MGQNVSNYPKQPQLEQKKRREKDPNSDAEVTVTLQRRGILTAETRHYDASNIHLMKPDLSARQQLSDLCEKLRDQLENWGLPSDRNPRWIRVDNGDWEPMTEPSPKWIPGRTIARALWISVLEANTEPLSKEREAGEHLWILTKLLERADIDDDYLWLIGRGMQSVSNY